MEKTLLLVDDEQNILRSLKRSLGRNGITILTAQSGEEGLEILAQNQVGVIISDQRMPGMKGTEFLKRTRELYPDTLRMMLSGYTELTSVTEAINQGEIYKFLTKPWDDEVLRSCVSEAFDFYTLRNENKRLTSELTALNLQLEKRVDQRTREVLLSCKSLKLSQDVLEHLPVSVVCTDSDGLIVNINLVAREFYSRVGNGMVGMHINQLIPSINYPIAENNRIEQTYIVCTAGAVKNIIVYSNTLTNNNKERGDVFVIIPEKVTS